MEWKYEAINKLKGYEAHKRSLENIPEELARLGSAFVSVRGATTDSTPVSGGGSTQEDVMLSNIVHRQELKRTLKQAKLWVSTVDRAMSVLDNEERKVLEMMYIYRAKGNVDRLCDALGIEKAQVYRRRDKALRHFTIALYGITET